MTTVYYTQMIIKCNFKPIRVALTHGSTHIHKSYRYRKQCEKPENISSHSTCETLCLVGSLSDLNFIYSLGEGDGCYFALC